MSHLTEFDKADTESGRPQPIGTKNGKLVKEQRTTFIFRPTIDMKINDKHQLELTIPEEQLTLITKPDTLFNEKKEVLLVFTSKEKIGIPLINIVMPKLTDKRSEFTDKRPAPTVLAIISRTTGRPLHYGVEQQYITANVSLTEGVFNANYHRVNATSTGQQEIHTITANMNNFRVKVDNNNGDLVVASVTDTTESDTIEFNSCFQKEEVSGSNGFVRFFIDISKARRHYLTVGDDGRVCTQSQLTNGSDFFIVVE